MDPRSFSIRELTMMCRGATFIWTEIARGLGGSSKKKAKQKAQQAEQGFGKQLDSLGL